jgi:peroxiredoxin
LRRWAQDLSDDLEQRGLQIVTVCTDAPEQIARARTKHGLKGIFLSDPQLVVTDLFGLRNLNTAVRPRGLPGLPIPTTLMIDATGVVRWKDQSADYMQRSDPDYVRSALDAHFANPHLSPRRS